MALHSINRIALCIALNYLVALQIKLFGTLNQTLYKLKRSNQEISNVLSEDLKRQGRIQGTVLNYNTK